MCGIRNIDLRYILLKIDTVSYKRIREKYGVAKSTNESTNDIALRWFGPMRKMYDSRMYGCKCAWKRPVETEDN